MNKTVVDTTRMAFQTMRQNRLRSALTVFGITVGIAMVIMVYAAGHGMKQLILSEISSFGDNWINIEIKIPNAQKNSHENASSLGRGVTITTLTTEDARAIEDLSDVDATYAGISTQAVVAYENQSERPMIFGVGYAYPLVSPLDMAHGRFYSEAEDRGAQSVVVLGSGIADTLFGNTNPIGKQIRINSKPFEVVGVVTSLGAAGFMDMDHVMYIPVTTVQKKMMGVSHVLWIIAKMAPGAKPQIVAGEITDLMRERHAITDPSKDDFSVTTMEEAIGLVQNIITGITVLLTTLAAVSLVVGGVGIMNVMYVSVVERTFEIGLRKAVGATERDISRQFLTESVVLSAVGGLVGIIIGIILSLLISLIATSQGMAWEFYVSPLSLFLSLSFVFVIGIVFGVQPARRAAKLDAIVALREEF